MLDEMSPADKEATLIARIKRRMPEVQARRAARGL